MTHIFVSPHADDAALSCGGLIASLRELGQNVTILTVYSGAGSGDGLSPYQREALGFGTKALWPATEAFNRADILADYPLLPDGPGGLPPWQADDARLEATQEEADASAKRFWQRASWYRRASIRARPLAGQPVIDALPTQGPVFTSELMDAASAGDLMAQRRLEDERYAYFAEASVVFLDLPDAVFRGYQDDDALLGSPRTDDPPPVDLLRREILRLEPQRVYFPLAVGNHVDHQLCRAVGLALLGQARDWIMPGPDWTGIVAFYEDFPYAWWRQFRRLEDLPPGALAGLPPSVSLQAEYADIGDQLERKITGIGLYESQLGRLFGSAERMADAVRGFAAQVGALSPQGGFAERYWVSTPI
jgi:LmbE family N-acetylglucosaminyl deacetylase